MTQKRGFRRKIAVFILLISALATKAQEYNFDYFDQDDGLSQQYIYDLITGDDGRIYVASSEGLVSFDGQRFTTYHEEDGLRESFCYSLFKAPNGHIWMGHFQEGLSVYDGRTFKNIQSSSFAGNRVEKIAADTTGKIWLASGSGLHYVQGDSIMNVEGEHPSMINDFVLRNDTFFISSSEGFFIYRIHSDHTSLIPVQVPKTLHERSPLSVVEHNGTIWIGTRENGLFGIRGKNIHTDSVLHITLPMVDGEQIPVSQICSTFGNAIWIGSSQYGLLKIAFTNTSQETWNIRSFNAKNGLPNEMVQCLYSDENGILWVGTIGGGMVRLKSERYLLFNRFPEAPSIDIHAITAGPDNFLWLGTTNGLIRFGGMTDLYPDHYGLDEGFIDGQVNALHADKNHFLWIGTEDYGLWRKNLITGHFESVNRLFGLTPIQINTIVPREDGVIYFGTTLGMLIFDPSTNSFEHLTMEDRLASNLIYDIHIDAAETFWFAAHGVSLFRYKNGNYKIFKEIPANTYNKLNAVTADKNGNIWFCTEGNGVFKQVSADSFVQVSIEDGLLSQYCYDILTDQNDRIWVTHRAGISIIHPDGRIQKIDKTTGLIAPVNNLNATFVDPNGSIWFGTSEGLMLYDASSAEAPVLLPVLNFEGISIDGKFESDPKAEMALPYKSYDVRFHFSGIHHPDPLAVTYHFKLEGYDEQWRTADATSTFIDYLKLKDGDYTFQLKACLADSHCSEMAVGYHFSVNVPIWKKAWFYILLFFLFGAITYVYSMYRTRKIRLDNIKLEKIVGTKTLELRLEKDNLQDAKTELEHKNKDIMDSINYAKRIQDAILPRIDFRATNAADGFVFFQPRDVVSGDYYWFSHTKGKSFFAACDCTGHGVPGAFMSMIGTTLLNKIVNEQGVTDLSEILRLLNYNIVESLKQKGIDSHSSDGMDMALVAIDEQKNIEFVGAIRPLYLLRKGEIEVVSGSVASIGGYCEGENKQFITHQIKGEKGDRIFIFSDGIVDQFGGPKDKKYMPKRLKETLLDAANDDAAAQGIHLSKKWNEWKFGYSQTDDALLIGIEL